MQSSSKHWWRGALAVGAVTAWLAWPDAAAAQAEAPSAPAVSGGNYTVSYAPCQSCLADWLEERAEGGTWVQLGGGARVLTGKPEGTYYYRVGFYYWLDSANFSLAVGYSAETRVIVAANVPTIEPLTTQLGYGYETRFGDGNGDGRLDLYVRRVSGGSPGDGALDSTLLLQGAGGLFTSLDPSAAQESTARTWPRAAVDVALGDYNVDGFVDLLLRGVGAATGNSSASGQIVYAPGRVLSDVPLGVHAVDAELQRFALEAHDYLADDGYFEKNAPYVTVYSVVHYYYCSPSYNFDSYGTLCVWLPYVVPVVVQDYSVFSPDALDAWTQEKAIRDGRLAQSQGIDAIKRSFEHAIGVQIGGWDFDGVRAEDAALDAPRRRGFELFLAVLGIFNANADELGRDERREPEVVYITGRRVLGFLSKHTALEYNGSTISAFDSDASAFGSGRLVSEVDWPSDQPPLMMTLGTVSWSLGAAAYWQRLLLADSRYDDDLPYAAVPTPIDDAYNSNGYTHGIIRATAGVPSIDLNAFVGGPKPVPPGAFY